MSDGRIHLRPHQLSSLCLHHLATGLDEDAPSAQADCALSFPITGYTEWISTSPPGLSLGWDWKLAGGGDKVWLLRVGVPRSNLVLTSARAQALDDRCNDKLVQRFVDSFAWQAITLRELADRYGNCAKAATRSCQD